MYTILNTNGEQCSVDLVNIFDITPPAKVLKTLRNLNLRKTPGLDGWHLVFLKSITLGSTGYTFVLHWDSKMFNIDRNLDRDY